MTRFPKARLGVALAVFVTACADDGATVPGEDSSSSTGADDTTTAMPSTTGNVESSSSDTIADSSSEDGPTSVDSSSSESSSSESSSSESSSSGGDTVCGDDSVDAPEVCDGDELSGADCLSEGFDAGTLGCLDDCTDYDVTACVSFSCGNNLAEGAEICDGPDHVGETCQTVGFDAGALGCQDDCTAFDTSGCVSFMCGNNTLEGMEVCDGSDLAGEDCLSLDFDAGTLGCNAGCSAFDTSACTTFACGNDNIEGVEVCDGDDLAGADCISQGFDAGTLGCQANCSDYDTQACVMFACGNGNVEGAESCDSANLNGEDCVSLGFDAGALACTAGCAFDTDACVTFACGNNAIEGGEFCDGTDLAGEDCVSQGFDAGSLGCFGDCSDYDVSGCVTFSCGNDTVEGSEVCDGSDLAGEDCASQGFDAGTLACVGDCAAFDTTACTECGDFVIEGGETCEGFNLNGATCGTAGFAGGFLYCSGACGYDTAQCFAQVSETEPNDDGATAVATNDFSSANANGPFTDDVLIAAAIGVAGDDDVFAVTNQLAVNQTLSVETFGAAVGVCAVGTDTVVNVRDAGGGSLISDDDGGIGACSLISAFTLTPGQTVYVHVVDFDDNAAIASYFTQLVLRPVGCGNGALEAGESCDDRNLAAGDGCSPTCTVEGLITEVEPNGTTAQADATGLIISSNTAHTRIAGSINPAADHDLYRIEVANAGVLRLETFSTLGRCNITTTMTLRDAAGAQILTDNISGIASCSAIAYPIPAGTYYVDVNETGDNAVLAAYVLEASFVPDQGAESEDNGAIATADFLAQNVDMYVFGDHAVAADADFYALYVPSGASLKLETIEGSLATETCESNGIDTTIQLLNSAGTALFTDDDSGRGFCSLVDGTGDVANNAPPAHTLQGGLYYVRVQAASVGAAGEFVYRLVATIRTP